MSFNYKFFTTVQFTQDKKVISPRTSILTVGSCFSENIGKKLKDRKFNVLSNPFGTVFNPVSMCNLMQYAIDAAEVEEKHLFKTEDRYVHFDFHSQFSSSNVSSTLTAINQAVIDVHHCIKSLDVLILTFGTSIAYSLNTSKKVVSNCHKVPSSFFMKNFLPLKSMISRTSDILESLHRINPKLNIVLTVSPVRHSKDGMVANSHSKARLIELCHALVEHDDRISYFPAYEIMMDELRDYRFYETDLIHPTSLAVDIIWNRFKEAYFDSKALSLVDDIERLLAAKAHRPFDHESETHKSFKRKQLDYLNTLCKKYPTIDLADFYTYFNEE